MTEDGPNLARVTKLPSANASVEAARHKAKAYLGFYNWVAAIEEEHLGLGVEGIIYIFLFRISSNRADVDPWIWVIVGDLPSAYITCENAKTPAEALDGYIGAMEEWVEAARKGHSVANIIPVNVAATPANAELLDKRLKFLDREILRSLTEAK